MSDKIVRAGVAVFLWNERGEFLIGRRRGSHGAGTWGLPGGHIEFGEAVVHAATREVFEETGIRVTALVHSLGWSEAVFREEGKHYLTALCSALAPRGAEPLLVEPERCSEWRWVNVDRLPMRLFSPLANYLVKELHRVKPPTETESDR